MPVASILSTNSLLIKGLVYSDYETSKCTNRKVQVLAAIVNYNNTKVLLDLVDFLIFSKIKNRKEKEKKYT